ncbi:MAG: hypothetical protein NTV79_02205 [Candidatus Aureabacteria bacterium]|nr:hypothetical protein [Candidatus Auribacterota bacterium]
MPRLLIIGGSDRAEREEVLERMTSALSAAGLKVGVAIHAPIAAEEGTGEREGALRFSRAGAVQVLFTRGKDTALRGKQGGLTPLKRLGARYFNAADILLASGYFDPVPLLEACLSDDPARLKHLKDPRLTGVVCRRLRPGLPVPVYLLDDLSSLVRAVMACPAP